MSRHEEFDGTVCGFQPYDLNDTREFYSICEHCGRAGHEGRGPQFDGDKECERCYPLRERVAWREIGWKLHFAMVRLGRLPNPWRR